MNKDIHNAIMEQVGVMKFPDGTVCNSFNEVINCVFYNMIKDGNTGLKLLKEIEEMKECDKAQYFIFEQPIPHRGRPKKYTELDEWYDKMLKCVRQAGVKL